MKVKSFQIPALSSQIQKDFDAIVVYGTDEGEIQYTLTQLRKQLHFSSENLTSFTKEIIKKTPFIVTDEANTTSLIQARRFLFIPEDVSFSIEAFTHFLNNKKTDTLLIIQGGNLSKTNALRLEAEKNPRVLAVVCYQPTLPEIQRMIIGYFQSHQKKISSSVVTELCKKISLNQELINKELEKLLLYIGDQPEITLKDIDECLTTSTEFSLDDFCVDLADGNVEKVVQSIHLFINSEEIETTLLWAVRNYFERLLKIISNTSEPLEQVIQKNTKSFQFYLKEPLMRQARFWTQQTLLDVLKKLTKLEALTRSTGYPKDTLIEQFFLSLVSRAQKLTRLR